MAILRLAFCSFSRTSGSWMVTSWSAMKRLMPRMETGASSVDAAALVLAGMEANPRADRRKRIALAVQPQGLGIALLGHQRDVAGNIDVGRAGALAGRMDQRRADARAAVLVANVLDVFVAEMADGREHGVGGRLPQAAQRRVLDHFAQLDQPLDVGFFALAFADAVEDFQHPLGAHAAGDALAARFFLDELQEEAGHVDHAAVLVHDDQAAGAHDRAEFGERFVVQGRR